MDVYISWNKTPCFGFVWRGEAKILCCFYLPVFIHCTAALSCCVFILFSFTMCLHVLLYVFVISFVILLAVYISWASVKRLFYSMHEPELCLLSCQLYPPTLKQLYCLPEGNPKLESPGEFPNLARAIWCGTSGPSGCSKSTRWCVSHNNDGPT